MSAATGVVPLAWWARDFPGRAFQVREARRWIAGLLPECAIREDVLLLATEICTNAIVHTRSGLPGGRFSVHLEWSPSLARVVVGDEGALAVPAVAASPAARVADAESGRGLLLVAKLADGWGTARHPDGRCTWFAVDWQVRGGLPLIRPPRLLVTVAARRPGTEEGRESA